MAALCRVVRGGIRNIMPNPMGRITRLGISNQSNINLRFRIRLFSTNLKLIKNISTHIRLPTLIMPKRKYFNEHIEIKPVVITATIRHVPANTQQKVPSEQITELKHANPEKRYGYEFIKSAVALTIFFLVAY